MTTKRNPGYLEMITMRGQAAGLPLFDGARPAPPREISDGSDVKAAAMAEIKRRGRVQGHRFFVLEAVFALGEATDHEVAARLEWEINRVIPRRRELQELGLIVKAGEKTGGYGLKNILWKVDPVQLKNFAGS